MEKLAGNGVIRCPLKAQAEGVGSKKIFAPKTQKLSSAKTFMLFKWYDRGVKF
jgi:hypothetical protein